MKLISAVCVYFMLFLIGCTSYYEHKGKIPLVEVEGGFLYKEDLEPLSISFTNKDDSLLLAEQFIRSWVEEELLYNKAKRNVPDMQSIERLVENYKKTLIVHAYKQELIKQRLLTNITNKEVESYYNEYKELFILEQPMIQGLFIKIPQAALGINNVRKWYKQKDSMAVEYLEKYSLHNAVKYEYFYDKWIPAGAIVDMLPRNSISLNYLIERDRNIELQDSAYYYFLNVSDVKKVGEQEPLEYAKQKINDIIVNNKQTDFIRQVKKDLYQKAVKNNKIKYNY